jgi:hypothetical protein
LKSLREVSIQNPAALAQSLHSGRCRCKSPFSFLEILKYRRSHIVVLSSLAGKSAHGRKYLAEKLRRWALRLRRTHRLQPLQAEVSSSASNPSSNPSVKNKTEPPGSNGSSSAL